MSKLKQVLIMLLIIILSNIYVLIYSIRKGLPHFTNYFNNLVNINVKVVNIDKINNFTKDRLIIMSNHMNGTDYLGMAQIFNNLNTNKNKKLYTLVISNLFTADFNKNLLTSILSKFGNTMFNFCNFIPYTKRDKNSGSEARKKIIELINSNNTIIIFPEGTVTQKGIPDSFKPGTFELCKDNNISILPISIKYNKNIGLYDGEPLNLFNWFNLEQTLYIHDIITPESCNNSTEMMQKTLEVIRKPLINK